MSGLLLSNSLLRFVTHLATCAVPGGFRTERKRRQQDETGRSVFQDGQTGDLVALFRSWVIFSGWRGIRARGPDPSPGEWKTGQGRMSTRVPQSHKAMLSLSSLPHPFCLVLLLLFKRGCCRFSRWEGSSIDMWSAVHLSRKFTRTVPWFRSTVLAKHARGYGLDSKRIRNKEEGVTSWGRDVGAELTHSYISWKQAQGFHRPSALSRWRES